MNPYSSYRRRRTVFSPMLIVFLLVVGVVGTMATLVALGEVDLSFLTPILAQQKEKPLDTRGMAAVPVSAMTIPAYTSVDLGHLYDKEKQQFSFIFLPPDRVPKNVITDVSEIRGRVLKRQKGVHLAFTERDFFPKGTRPGMTAGIPPGKRGVRLEATQIKGFYGLRQGDHFDIVATLPVEDGQNDLSKLNLVGPFRKQLEMEARLSNFGKQAQVKVIVQNGMVVQGVDTRAEPYKINSLTQGTRYGTRPVQEIILAVDPEEVAPLTSAIAVEAELMCVPRSGHPDDPPDSVTPDLQPRNPFLTGGTGARETGESDGEKGAFGSLRLIERISGSGRGTSREIQAVPNRK